MDAAFGMGVAGSELGVREDPGLRSILPIFCTGDDNVAGFVGGASVAGGVSAGEVSGVRGLTSVVVVVVVVVAVTWELLGTTGCGGI